MLTGCRINWGFCSQEVQDWFRSFEWLLAGGFQKFLHLFCSGYHTTQGPSGLKTTISLVLGPSLRHTSTRAAGTQLHRNPRIADPENVASTLLRTPPSKFGAPCICVCGIGCVEEDELSVYSILSSSIHEECALASCPSAPFLIMIALSRHC